MGIEVAIAVAAAAEGGKMLMESNAASAQENALTMQSKEQQVVYQQKTLQNLDAVEKVIDAQAAQMTIRGTSFSSPSFNAIQRDTLNVGAKQQRNLDTEEDLIQSNIDTEKDNVRNKLYASLFGDVASFAMSAANVSGNMPRLGGK